jgi:hypothetical protein
VSKTQKKKQNGKRPLATSKLSLPDIGRLHQAKEQKAMLRTEKTNRTKE